MTETNDWIWAAQDPRSPVCDYCGEFRDVVVDVNAQFETRLARRQCRCEARRLASRPQQEEGA